MRMDAIKYTKFRQIQVIKVIIKIKFNMIYVIIRLLGNDTIQEAVRS